MVAGWPTFTRPASAWARSRAPPRARYPSPPAAAFRRPPFRRRTAAGPQSRRCRGCAPPNRSTAPATCRAVPRAAETAAAAALICACLPAAWSARRCSLAVSSCALAAANSTAASSTGLRARAPSFNNCWRLSSTFLAASYCSWSLSTSVCALTMDSGMAASSVALRLASASSTCPLFAATPAARSRFSSTARSWPSFTASPRLTRNFCTGAVIFGITFHWFRGNSVPSAVTVRRTVSWVTAATCTGAGASSSASCFLEQPQATTRHAALSRAMFVFIA